MKPRAALLAALVVGLAACAAPPNAGPATGQVTPAPPDDVVAESLTTTTPAPVDAATPAAVPAPTPGTPSVAGAGQDDERGQATSPVPQPPDGPDAAATARAELPQLQDEAAQLHASSAAADDLARAWAGADPADWRVLSGFVGSQWDQELSGTIDVLAESITVRDGVAMGLVRNGRTTDAGPITVIAGTAQATAMVPVARPGEPVPFRLPLGGVDPAAVEWTAVAPESRTEAVAPVRELMLATWWQRGVTDARPADNYLWTDPESGPRPIVVFGMATALDVGVQDIEIASAWVDADGRVIGVADGIVGHPSVPAGASADFVVATTGPDELDGAALMLWGWGA